MKLTLATREAVQYACLHFHYAKKIPIVSLAYNVYNKENEWCGVICYGVGANFRIARPFGLAQGEVIELLRVALNGKQEMTSQAVALSMRLIKKDAPFVKILVSYADEEQNHKGVIYQAMNWIYTGESFAKKHIELHTGKTIHSKTAHEKYGKNAKRFTTEVKSKAKHRYIYPLYKEYRDICNSMAQEKTFMRQ